MSQTRIDYDPALSAFLRPHAERSAAPVVDREPEKRGLPPAAPVEPAKADRVDSRAFPPEAVETFVRSETFTEEVRGILSTKCLVGKAPTGERLPEGSNAWHWLRVIGHQTDGGTRREVRQEPPVHVKGAVYGDKEDARKAAKRISEAEEMRKDRDAWLRSVGLEEMNPAKVARGKMGRR